MAFTDPYIRNLKTTKSMEDFREKAGENFGVRVYPTGTKTFFYVFSFDGKQHYLNLGKYPTCSLTEARKRHREAKSKLDRGINPLTERQTAEAIRLKTPTVEELAKEYMEKHVIPNKKDQYKDKHCLKNDILPAWGKRKASDIKKRDVILLLESVVDRGSPGQSNSVLGVARKMFNFAIERDLLEHTPFIGVKALGPKNARTRFLSEQEIKTVWDALKSGCVSNDMKRALRLILVTAQRPGEVAGMHRKEINGHWWTISADRAKNGREHLVYLTDLALELIGDKDGYIFESPRDRKLENNKTVKKPFDTNALSHALRRISPSDCGFDLDTCQNETCKKDKRPCGEKNKLGVPFFRPHDLRRTANTHFARLKVPLEIREVILNHSRGDLDAIYNLHDYQDEKQIAMEAWERELNRITKGKELANVIPMMKASGF
jgi:integrase